MFKTKLNDLDAKLSKLTLMFFSYHIATMKYLKDKGLADLLRLILSPKRKKKKLCSFCLPQ